MERNIAMSFKENFVWGAATASYQIEGGWNADGKGLSVWDTFSHTTGKVFGGHTGDVACDHYHRFREDVQLMKRIGLKAYRFSINWARVLPNGVGALNEAGLRFYDELIDELLANDIDPWVTLFHWDYPQELYYRGGWLNAESPRWFEEYTQVLAERFKGRVRHYMTFNEPICFIGMGHSTGEHAPGLKLSRRDTLRAVRHVQLAHGLAVKKLREICGVGVKVGMANNGGFYIPQTDSPEDIEAARKASFSIGGDPSFDISMWADPIFLGKLPDEADKIPAWDLPSYSQEDFEIMSQPLDFYGANIYHGTVVKAAGDSFETVDFAPGHTKTAIDWPATPSVLYWAPKFLYERYRLPVIITENGLSCADTVSLDGKAHDPQRIDFTNRYLLEYRRAAKDGVELAGYFQWSLMDNFEWAKGYNERFGMVYVDYATQQRTLKDSAYWYTEIIESNGDKL